MYKNVADLAALSMTTYIIATIATILSLLLAWFIANNIAFEGGLDPQDHKKRTKWFWAIGILLPILFFSFCFFYFRPDVLLAFRPRYETTIGISTGVSFAAYIVIGRVLKMLSQNRKFGTVGFPF